jgi:hypothetical protein
MWFYHTCEEFGIEKANTLNKAAIQSLAPIEMKRTRKILGFDKEDICTADELKNFMLEALELVLPYSVFAKIQFSASSKDLLHWEWQSGECFAYKGLKQIGIIDGYSCGVMFRIKCWLDALGIKNTINPKVDRCLMHAQGSCSGDIRIFLDG